MATLNERIKAKLAELEDDREDRQRAWTHIRALEVKVSDVVEDLQKARRRVRRYRAKLEEIRADLAQKDAETRDEDTPEEQALRARRDRLAGEYEEAIAIRDRLLDKLDRLKDRQEDARGALDAAVAESEEDREALQRMRNKRERIREARARNDHPSPNFDWAEFDCNDGTEAPEESKPAIRHWCQTVGEPTRAVHGPIDVTSGFRHRAYNARIGGEDASVHIYDYPGRDYRAVAVDFKCARGTPRDWYGTTAGKADGRGLYSTFTHADNRNRIGWPDAVWSG